MTFLHQRLAIAVVLYLAIVTIWGLVLAVRKLPVSPSYRGMLMVAEIAILAEALVGLVLFTSGSRPHDNLHFLYGLIAILLIPIALTYLRNRRPERHTLILGIATLFLTGIAIRAMMTGAGPQ